MSWWFLMALWSDKWQMRYLDRVIIVSPVSESCCRVHTLLKMCVCMVACVSLKRFFRFLELNVLQYFVTRYNPAPLDAFAEVVKVTNYTALWHTKLTWYSMSLFLLFEGQLQEHYRFLNFPSGCKHLNNFARLLRFLQAEWNFLKKLLQNFRLSLVFLLIYKSEVIVLFIVY